MAAPIQNLRKHILAATTCAILLSLVTLLFVIDRRGPNHQLPRQSSPFDGVILVTHHKTGTAAVGCIVGALSMSMDVQCQHLATPIYVNAMLSSSAISHYLSVSQVISSERFGRVQSPYLLLKTGSAPKETCFDTGSMAGESTFFIQHTNLHSHRPGNECPGECPCHHGVINCLTIGSCMISEPLEDLLWVHFIRRPLDIVISAYAYHTKFPAPEAWLKQLSIRHYAFFLASQGVDNATLISLGVYGQRVQSTSYWQFLRSLPEGKGLLLEFLRSSPQLWSMARHHLRMSRLEGRGRALTVRYEDLQADPKVALHGLLGAVSTSCMQRGEAQFMAFLKRTCHPGSWSHAQLANNTHIGRYSSLDGMRRADLLLAQPIVSESVLHLDGILGYSSSSSSPS